MKKVAQVILLGFVLAMALEVGAGATKHIKQHHHVKHEQVTLSDEIKQNFKAWKERFAKRYDSEEEETFRLSVYAETLAYIEEENARQSDYWLGENQFSDLTHDEFKARYLGGLKLAEPLEKRHEADYLQGYVVPTTPLDWRLMGASNPPKNQGQCGCCYTFSTVAVVEGFYAIYKGYLPSLSEQQIVDCAQLNSKYHCHGCDGGDPFGAMTYVQDVGLNTETQYPFTGKVGSCQKTSGAYKIGAPFRSFGCAHLVSNLLLEPTAVSIDASAKSFMSYKGGVFTGCTSNGSTDHAVTAIGWDSGGNWIVKNSWDVNWGEGGHVRFQNGNMCHICEYLINAL